MERVKFEVDPHNRLRVKDSSLRGMRKVLDGQFKITGHNTLTYHVKSPVPSAIKAPHQIKLKGSWSLTQAHQLRLTLDKWLRPTFGDEITLQGEILDVKNNALLFALKSRTKDGLPSMYILELSGSWQADERNRLSFRVERGRGRFDALTFDGIWQVNENYQIAYNYQKERLVRKSKETQGLIFKGYWDIRDKARLSYVLEARSGSRFDFNTGIGIFKKNYIKYELGIEVSRRKEPVKQGITFLGSWKINKDTGLTFEVGRQGRRVQSIVFGAQVSLRDKGRVSFSLRNSFNKGLGAELELSRDIFKGGGQAFLRLLEARQELTILAGVGWRW